jgi:hypothetical protein
VAPVTRVLLFTLMRVVASPLLFAEGMNIRSQLRRWQECLLDQTARNPLLHLHGSRTTRLQVTMPDALALFRMLALEGRKLRLPSGKHRGEVVFVGASEEEIARKLRRIQDNARTSLEERGVATLHLALGALHWSDARLGGHAVSPLWLVPCRLETHGPDRPWTLEQVEEDVRINPALELYLRERHKVRLPEAPEDLSLESMQSVLEAIDAEAQERGWKVESESWLSTFSFESLVLWRDLDALEEEAEKHPVVRSFARLPVEVEPGDALPEDLDSIPLPVPILETDSSQLEALGVAAAGRNLVIHGPPGTGKSQTIANLIADALGRGKTVLFVSAKMAALEVVHRRLVERGLGDYCLEAHSARGSKTRVIAELKRVLENAELEPESALEERVEDLVAVRDRLNGYVHGLHEPRGELALSL